MKPAYDTTAFVVTQSEDGPAMEIWIDWVPSVDGAPMFPLAARLDDDVLVIEPVGDKSDERVARRVIGLQHDVLDEIKGQRGFSLYICGPSGVIGSHHLTI